MSYVTTVTNVNKLVMKAGFIVDERGIGEINLPYDWGLFTRRQNVW